MSDGITDAYRTANFGVGSALNKKNDFLYEGSKAPETFPFRAADSEDEECDVVGYRSDTHMWIVDYGCSKTDLKYLKDIYPIRTKYAHPMKKTYR
jgi:hypothetical protein